jgi:hypothetical protein
MTDQTEHCYNGFCSPWRHRHTDPSDWGVTEVVEPRVNLRGSIIAESTQPNPLPTAEEVTADGWTPNIPNPWAVPSMKVQASVNNAFTGREECDICMTPGVCDQALLFDIHDLHGYICAQCAMRHRPDVVAPILYRLASIAYDQSPETLRQAIGPAGYAGESQPWGEQAAGPA